MSLTKPEIVAQVAEHIAAHNAHGYSQPNRMGDGTTETITLSDGSTVQIHGGDYDCSELVRMCNVCAGILPASSYMWTGNETALLTEHGYKVISADNVNNLRRGDVLLSSGHTAVYLGKKRLAEASRSEHHTTNGTKGDQDAWEIHTTTWRSGWLCAFRYKEEPGETLDKETATKILTGDIMYCIIAKADGTDEYWFVAASRIIHLNDMDQVKALRSWHKEAFGAAIPEFAYGTKSAPWGARLLQAFGQEKPIEAGKTMYH